MVYSHLPSSGPVFKRYRAAQVGCRADVTIPPSWQFVILYSDWCTNRFPGWYIWNAKNTSSIPGTVEVRKPPMWQQNSQVVVSSLHIGG